VSAVILPTTAPQASAPAALYTHFSSPRTEPWGFHISQPSPKALALRQPLSPPGSSELRSFLLHHPPYPSDKLYPLGHQTRGDGYHPSAPALQNGLYARAISYAWDASFVPSIIPPLTAIASEFRGQSHTRPVPQVSPPPELAQNPSIVPDIKLTPSRLLQQASCGSMDVLDSDAVTLYPPPPHTACISAGIAGSLFPVVLMPPL